MTEPEFYRVKHSGVLIDSTGILLQQADGSKKRYYGISYDMLQDAIKQGYVAKSANPSCVHTWDDYGLFLVDVAIAPPDVEKNTATVPGRHGVLDYSETLSGAPVFHNRTITLTLLKLCRMEMWHTEYHALLAKIHGKKMMWILDTDPGYYFYGRCEVSSVRDDGAYSTFTLTMDAEPFMRSIMMVGSDWLWDPFCFVDGVIRNYNNISINKDRTTVYLIGCDGVVVSPTLSVKAAVAGDLTVQINGTVHTYSMKSGYNTFQNAFLLNPGENSLVLQCKTDNVATVSVIFQEERM